MNSYRAAVLAVASALLVLAASPAFACKCKEMSAEQSFASSDLVLKGRMKSVTVGVEMPDPKLFDGQRQVRGEFEIDKVLKGTVKGKSLSVYTGFGNGDCGRLGEFVGATYLYRDQKMGVVEFGMTKTELAGQTLYFTGICDYAKFPEGGQ